MQTFNIMSASCIFGNKLKITLDEVKTEWSDGAVVVVKKPNGTLGFIAGCSGKYAEIGEKVKCVNDQTLRDLGIYEVVAVVNYDGKDNVVEGEFDLSTKATISVFK